MPMKLLATLVRASLPCTFDDLDDIERIRVLKAHEHIEATIPPWSFDSVQEPATVHVITERGYKALKNVPPPSSEL